MKTKRVNIIEKINGYFERKRIEKQIAERQEAMRQVRAEYFADKVRNYTISKDGYLFLDIEPYLANESIEVTDMAMAEDEEYIIIPSRANDPKTRERIMRKARHSALYLV